jgi:hypothetical protein
VQVQCGFTDNPARLQYCDQTQNGIPWNTQFKAAGSIPLRWGLQAGASFTTYKYLYPITINSNGQVSAGGIFWQITRTTRYSADCKGPCTPGAVVNPGQTISTYNVPLAAPGTIFSDRVKQLDVTLGKTLKFGQTSVQPEISVFNALNNRAAYAVRSMAYLTSSFMQPSLVLQPRVLRLGVQMKW